MVVNDLRPGSLAGRLLVAAPPLVDPHFDRTVVLLLDHDADGAFGLVLNRPVEATMFESFPEWSAHAAEPRTLFAGGPVQTESLIGLARATGPEAEAWKPLPLRIPDAGPLGTVDLDAAPDAIPSLELIRVFVGYSGWGPGQLEAELEAKAWIVTDAVPSDAFTSDPSQLWRRVLARQRDASVARIGRLFPDDVRLN